MIVFNYFGHLVLGAIFAYFFADNTLMALLIMFGSLYPDIDHPKSTLGRYNPAARFGFMKHRGFTHTILGATIISLPFLLISQEAFYAVLIGCGSHILGDKLASFKSSRKFKIRLW